ncbi:MAG: sigma-54-dependent Fis family transcriptional regulator [Candidatus Cloacimonetes bacterium]|nr:sigma-54-dependent Fis family transcriptional regulator [Candidatus Cloacimonadota bacterium]
MNTILIVEDDKNLQYTLTQILQESGYRIISTIWGSMALEEVKKGSPDLVLLDIMLPGMNGMEVLERMKDMDKHIPVIMITGYGSAESAVKAIELGAYDYITKPFDYEKLTQKISKALSSRNRKKKSAFLKHMRRISLDLKEYQKNILDKLKS